MTNKRKLLLSTGTIIGVLAPMSIAHASSVDDNSADTLNQIELEKIQELSGVTDEQPRVTTEYTDANTIGDAPQITPAKLIEMRAYVAEEQAQHKDAEDTEHGTSKHHKLASGPIQMADSARPVIFNADGFGADPVYPEFKYDRKLKLRFTALKKK